MFGSVAGGGRYDDLVARFTGQQRAGDRRFHRCQPADGGADIAAWLLADARAAGGGDGDGQGRSRRQSFAIVQELRAAGMRAEAYVGNGKMGDQFKYADKRGAAIAVIEGGDERARGEVTLEGSGAGRRAGQVGGKPRRLGRRTARRR